MSGVLKECGCWCLIFGVPLFSMACCEVSVTIVLHVLFFCIVACFLCFSFARFILCIILCIFFIVSLRVILSINIEVFFRLYSGSPLTHLSVCLFCLHAFLPNLSYLKLSECKCLIKYRVKFSNTFFQMYNPLGNVLRRCMTHVYEYYRNDYFISNSS